MRLQCFSFSIHIIIQAVQKDKPIFMFYMQRVHADETVRDYIIIIYFFFFTEKQALLPPPFTSPRRVSF